MARLVLLHNDRLTLDCCGCSFMLFLHQDFGGQAAPLRAAMSAKVAAKALRDHGHETPLGTARIGSTEGLGAHVSLVSVAVMMLPWREMGRTALASTLQKPVSEPCEAWC